MPVPAVRPPCSNCRLWLAASSLKTAALHPPCSRSTVLGRSARVMHTTCCWEPEAERCMPTSDHFMSHYATGSKSLNLLRKSARGIQPNQTPSPCLLPVPTAGMQHPCQGSLHGVKSQPYFPGAGQRIGSSPCPRAVSPAAGHCFLLVLRLLSASRGLCQVLAVLMPWPWPGPAACN